MSKQSNQRYRKELEHQSTSNRNKNSSSDSYRDEFEEYDDEFESDYSYSSYNDEDL